MPGILQTIWTDPDRFLQPYFAKYNKNPKSQDWRDWPYFAGDGAVVDKDGYFRILGRVDDVINVAGHRLGTKELESACLMVPEVAEAAVVAVVDETRGRGPEIYLALNTEVKPSKEIEQRVVKEIKTRIGNIATTTERRL